MKGPPTALLEGIAARFPPPVLGGPPVGRQHTPPKTQGELKAKYFEGTAADPPPREVIGVFRVIDLFLAWTPRGNPQKTPDVSGKKNHKKK